MLCRYSKFHAFAIFRQYIYIYSTVECPHCMTLRHENINFTIGTNTP